MVKFYQDKHVKKTLENKMKEHHVKTEKDADLAMTAIEVMRVTVREANNHVNA
jgi:hypothetical protein